MPADLYVSLCSHAGRPEVLTAWMDPSVTDERDPTLIDPSLNMYDPDNGPPYSAEFVARYRAAQEARNHRITDWVWSQLDQLKKVGLFDRAFILQRTWADPRLMDGALDPSDRPVGVCYAGDPKVANFSPRGIGLTNTLRTWLSMWSLRDSHCRGAPHLARIKVPALVIQSMADTGVFPSDARGIHDALGATDKTLEFIIGDHYLENPTERARRRRGSDRRVGGEAELTTAAHSILSQLQGTDLKSLVIGGTGPTGHFVVNGLLRRGHTVSILHTGRHEVAEIPAQVEHIHTDPFDGAALEAALAGRTFDLTIAAYGRLRSTCEVMRGKTERFISIGGVPAYRGYSNPSVLMPHGLPVPIAEEWPKSTDRSEDEKGYRVFRSESVVFESHPTATHFRYPLVYGPYQLVPREWCIVRRIRDRRPYIVLADGGLTLHHCGYAENIAHAVLLAVDRPDAAAGQVYNCGDADALTLRQVVDVVADALDHRWDVISIPYELAACARPLVGQPTNTHRVFDLTKLKTELGYTDVVAATRRVRAYRAMVARASAASGWIGGAQSAGSVRLRGRRQTRHRLGAGAGGVPHSALRRRTGIHATRTAVRARRHAKEAGSRASAQPCTPTMWWWVAVAVADRLRAERPDHEANPGHQRNRPVARGTCSPAGVARNSIHVSTPSTIEKIAPCVLARFQYSPATNGTNAPTSVT